MITLLLGYIFSAGGFVATAAIVGLWVVARPQRRAPRWTLAVLILFYVAASIRVVPWVLSRPLVAGLHQFTPADARVRSAAIIVLGARVLTVHGPFQRLALLDPNGAARVLEAAHVYRLFEAAWIVSSGGPGAGFNLESSATAMSDALVRLGIPKDRILLEASSKNTHEEAVLVAQIVRPLHVDTVVLVTTDIHMRRALGAFRAEGIDAQPAFSVDPLAVTTRRRPFVPDADALRFTRDVVHEYGGLVEYAARGWMRF